MLVVHANWTDGGLKLWAESLDACRRVLSERTPADSSGEPVHHVFATPRDTLASLLVEHDLAQMDDLDADGGSGRLHLRLPADPPPSFRPRPSDRLMGIVGAIDQQEDAVLGSFAVPCVRLRNEAAIEVLLGLAERRPAQQIEYGHSLRYWMTVGRFVLELLVDQRFIPTLIQARDAQLEAGWQPWLHDEAVRERVGALIAGMPPVVRAVVNGEDGRPWTVLEEALRTLTDATVRRALIADDFIDAVEGRDSQSDPHVAWLEGLLAERSHVTPAGDGGTEMLRDVGRWIGALDETGRDRVWRLGFELREPDESLVRDDGRPVDENVPWRLAFYLTDNAEEPVIIDAEQIRDDPAAAQVAAGGRMREPEELLVAELGRASRVYPRLESALAAAAPTGLDLTTREAHAFLIEYQELLEESGFAATVPEWWGRPTAQLAARLQVEAPELDEIESGRRGSAAARQNLLGFNTLVRYRWQIAVGDQRVTFDEFRALVKAAKDASLVRLHGQWVQVDPAQLAEAGEFFGDEADGEMTLLEAIQRAHGAGGKQFGLPVFGLDASGWVADLLGASSDAQRMPTLAQPSRFTGTLRPYQQIGLSWLSFLDRFGLGACLADDMGLGKTIQLIALLQNEREVARNGDAVGPTLLIVPTSVISNWQREIERFAPELTVHIHHGPDRPLGDAFVELAMKRDVVITTYTLISRDRETVSRVPWHRVVLDEAQYIKNPPTKQTATIRALETSRRVALTGTPVENRLSELWSIMEFCNPGYLGQPGEFRRRFAVPIERHRDPHKADQLRKLVQPFVLRRLKTDPTVIDDLPACVTTKEYATLTSEQAAMYEQTVNGMLGRVSRAEGIQRRGLVLSALVKLKQICNHPMQVKLNGELKQDALNADDEGQALLSTRSGKTQRLMSMLEEVLSTGDKALVFTQFRKMGHLLSAMMQHDLDAEVLFLHGGTPPAKRQQMIDRFQDPDGGVPIFVLSLKAGGLGLNLTAANHVFHFDRWWNPAVENQATDRAFRIGQTRSVHVHKFVCLGTLEERIDQMIEQKTELAQNIIGSGEAWLTELSTNQLRDLLTLRESAMEMGGEP